MQFCVTAVLPTLSPAVLRRNAAFHVPGTLKSSHDHTTSAYSITDACSRRGALLASLLLPQLGSSCINSAQASMLPQQQPALDILRPALCVADVQADYDRWVEKLCKNKAGQQVTCVGKYMKTAWQSSCSHSLYPAALADGSRPTEQH
jgi:hypothetical protein